MKVIEIAYWSNFLSTIDYFLTGCSVLSVAIASCSDWVTACLNFRRLSIIEVIAATILEPWVWISDSHVRPHSLFSVRTTGNESHQPIGKWAQMHTHTHWSDWQRSASISKPRLQRTIIWHGHHFEYRSWIEQSARAWSSKESAARIA